MRAGGHATGTGQECNNGQNAEILKQTQSAHVLTQSVHVLTGSVHVLTQSVHVRTQSAHVLTQSAHVLNTAEKAGGVNLVGTLIHRQRQRAR